MKRCAKWSPVVILLWMVTSSPQFLNAQTNLCRAYAKSGQFGEAISACEKAREINPTSPQVLHDLGWIQFHLSRYEDAKKTFQRVLALDPTNAAAHHDMGATYAMLNRMREAVQS